uniref:TOD1/MUCI70 glycosyltransferase-like domain-containing protein n=1 Tax=Aegilops tauschii subsp. strangulata TaxID=200361 RepID=A0A453PK03_AEGTS
LNLCKINLLSNFYLRCTQLKQTYGPCEIEFLPSVDNLVEPADYNNFTQFLLKYILTEGHLIGNGIFEPLFAGHQSLQEREETYYAKNQSLHCGFVEGPEGYPSSGFDLDEHDRAYMATCRVVVSSCIFGGSDYLRRPTKSRIGSYSKKNVCFIMFLDELTLTTLSSEGHIPDENGSIGLWRIVVVKNLPYKDMRRAGKVPKLLAHRLFPSALYSIWLDSKLRLHADPMLIIEYFLWRKKAEYAISVHYDRTCVWEEVLQNKRLNKYNHTAIDEQFYFYQSDGLVKFNASGHDPVLPSYVPEGSFIVRAHTPMSNLFSCLWFNEVNRFTSRDQLSFAYTYLKLRRMNAGRNFQLNMFKDCERRAVAKLFHHRANGTTDPPPKNLRTDKNHSSMPS